MEKWIDFNWGSPPGKNSRSFGHCQDGADYPVQIDFDTVKKLFPQKINVHILTQSGTFRGQFRHQGHSKSHQWLVANDLSSMTCGKFLFSYLPIFIPQLQTMQKWHFLVANKWKSYPNYVRGGRGNFKQWPKERVFLLGGLPWNQCHHGVMQIFSLFYKILK